jgi:hypothetical protein
MATSTLQKQTYEWTADDRGKGASTPAGIVSNFKKNFLEKEIEIVPGLMHSQYEVVKRTYFYQHNQFESGPTDENGDPKYFYDLVTDRNDDASKNIDLDTSDCYIKAVDEGSYLKSWLLRREFMGYAKESGFGKKLNELADDLPAFGTVVWKKIKNEKGRTDVESVELINLMNDPAVKNLKDGITIERHILNQSDLRRYKSWDQNEVTKLINSGQTIARVGFLDTNQSVINGNFATQVDEYTPFYEVYEYWGEMPRSMYEKYKRGGKPRVYTRGLPPVQEASRPTVAGAIASPYQGELNDSVYVMAIVSGVDSNGHECVLFCKEVSRDLFPYKEVHFRRRKGRWLGVGNYEACFDLTEKANEITNRYFSSLRIALLHLYQTRDKSHVKNMLTDLLDGDVVVSKSEIAIIPTEIRGASDYQNEMRMIEAKADRVCKSLEVVTGQNLPSNTPFKLGAQQLVSATKFFDKVQENMGLFLEGVFNEWLLQDFGESLTEEHVLEILDDVDDIEIYYAAKRKLFQYDVMKRYILEHNEMPTTENLQLVGQLVQDQIKKSPKQIRVEREYYTNFKYSVKMVITGENDRKKENLDTLSETYQVTAANPAALQDPRLMKLLNMVLEESGYSPLQINGINQTPTNPSLNPANQGGGGADNASPAAKALASAGVDPGAGAATAVAPQS